MERALEMVDELAADFVHLLRDGVRIPSVSNEIERHDDVCAMGAFVAQLARDRGADSVLVVDDLGKLENGNPIPPVVLAQWGSDPAKHTLCVYGHYDVMPAAVEDGWEHQADPFELVEKDMDGIGTVLFGRGSTDDKGPLLGWFCALQAMQAAGMALPVNLKLVAEGREEAGSEGMDKLVSTHPFFKENVDMFCISDNYWLGGFPCITYGLRGFCGMNVTVTGPERNLHSGIFGGLVVDPYLQVIQLLQSLTDAQGDIVIPSVLEDVQEVTDEERELYEAIHFDPESWRRESGLPHIKGDSKVDVLMRRWRFPSLTIHGIEASSPMNATIIASSVSARFSVRLVPDMDPAVTFEKIKAHLEQHFASLPGKNRLDVSMTYGARAFVSDWHHYNFASAHAAVKDVYHVEPEMTREGGSIPVSLVFQNTGRNVCLLPIGDFDGNAHGPNENISKKNFLQGIKLFVAYMHHLGKAQ
ncbi:Cytosolic non-specific dipeptidase [Porphyridium purpureum]|uniref:Cytosolic non-specific dipeptidase n=1 Tax=Porphyridium purpureum TaxID=35688 RepID=A0A5J4YQJ2_PORPP|nr:Cytosolic non-specific dipeptidase [Porphyridium purpureum]|eukprot:POR2540..scf222_8